MKPLLIRYWHGRSSYPEPPKQRSKNEVALFWEHFDSITRKSDDKVFFDGTLQEWVEKWGKKFLYYPPELADDKPEAIGGVIFVTPYGGWGMR